MTAEKPISNPYIYSSIIPIDSDMFFGREREMRRILEMVSRDNPQSVSIVGERRIGKSSLVWRVFHEIKKETHTRAIYLDCDEIAAECQSKDQFFQMVNQKFCEVEIPAPAVPLFTDYVSFKGFVRAAGRQGLKTILFMDEFEHLPDNVFADDTFFSNLRALAYQPDNRLAFVTVSKTALKELAHQAVKSSGFWNIFDTEYIGLLDHPSIQQLRNYGLEKTGLAFSKEEMDKMAYYAGDFPYFNQMACGFVWESKRDQTPVAWEGLETKLRPHYQEIWNHRQTEEQKFLKNMKLKEEFTLNDLLVRGIVIPVEKTYSPFTEYFAKLLATIFEVRKKKLSEKEGFQNAKDALGLIKNGKDAILGD